MVTPPTVSTVFVAALLLAELVLHLDQLEVVSSLHPLGVGVVLLLAVVAVAAAVHYHLLLLVEVAAAASSGSSICYCCRLAVVNSAITSLQHSW